MTSAALSRGHPHTSSVGRSRSERLRKNAKLVLSSGPVIWDSVNSLGGVGDRPDASLRLQSLPLATRPRTANPVCPVPEDSRAADAVPESSFERLSVISDTPDLYCPSQPF